MFNVTEYFYNLYVCHDLLPQEDDEQEASKNYTDSTVIAYTKYIIRT